MQRKEKTLIVVLVIALAVVILAGGIILYMGHTGAPDEAVRADMELLPDPGVPGYDRDAGPMVVRDLPSPVEPGEPFVGEEPEPPEYERLLEQVRSFCDYLDGRTYVREHDLSEGTYQRLRSVIAKLAERKPLVLDETMDVTRLAANIYHFFRVLGKQDSLLAADILRREREKLEAVMDLLYNWLLLDMQQAYPETDASIETLYHYGAYFLTTLGGTSYLGRRDSRTAFLVRYYSLLIVDQADRMTKNPYGVDILPHLERLATDLDLLGDIAYRSAYETELETIRERLVRR